MLWREGCGGSVSGRGDLFLGGGMIGGCAEMDVGCLSQCLCGISEQLTC